MLYAWVPFVAGLGSACLYVWAMTARSHDHDLRLWIMMSGGAVIGLLAVAQSVLAASRMRRLTRAQEDNKELMERLSVASAQSEQQQFHSELLTAMRGLTQILTGAIDLKAITRNILEILGPLLHSEEIALVLKPQDDGPPVLYALRRNGRTACAGELAGNEVELGTAALVMAESKPHKAIEDSRCIFCSPLFADREVIGAIRFELPLQGTAQENEEQIARVEATLQNITDHLAIAIQTPDLRDRAMIDSLTGLFRRRYFETRLNELVALARRYGTVSSLVLIDVDRFKQVNDRFGHRVGDDALRHIAETIRSSIRECDHAFRHGGDELAILLPETPAHRAALLCERLRTTLKARVLPTEAGPLTLTLSQGVVEIGPGAPSPGELVSLADRALYRAKEAGRDTFVVADAPAAVAVEA